MSYFLPTISKVEIQNMYCGNLDVTKLTLSQRDKYSKLIIIQLHKWYGLNDPLSLLILKNSIDTVYLMSQSTISTLQTKPSNESSNLISNHPTKETSGTQVVNKLKETIEYSYYKYLSRVVENSDD